MRHHTAITGVGRSGTTFLVMLLTELGMDTGYTPEHIRKIMESQSHAGLERPRFHLDPDAPYFVKGPGIMTVIRQVLACPDVTLDHVLVPMRVARDAAGSRVRIHNLAREQGRRIGGGLYGTRNPDDQQEALERKLYRFMVHLSLAHVPVTLIHFPTMVEDADYLYEKMKPVLHEVTRGRFRRAHRKLARPDFVHDFGDGNDGSDPAG